MALIDTLLRKNKTNNIFNLDDVSLQPNPENLTFSNEPIQPNFQNTSFIGNSNQTNLNADNFKPNFIQNLGNNLSYGVKYDLPNKINNLNPVNALNNIATGYKENVSTPFNINNLQDTGKGFATRLGEGLGTLRRFADTPLARGLITAGLVGATGGGALPMLALGVTAGAGRQYAKTADQTYRKQLEDMGIDTSDIRGNITDDIYKNIISSRRLQQMTYGELAQLDPTVAAAVQANPMLYNQVIPSTVANSILGKKGALADVNIEKIKAQTEKTKKEAGQVGKAKPPSTIIHKTEGSSGGKTRNFGTKDTGANNIKSNNKKNDPLGIL